MSPTNGYRCVRHVIWFCGMLLTNAHTGATDTCHDWRLPVPSNGARFCETTAGTMRCNITCDFGHYFVGAFHNEQYAEFICEGGYWMPEPAGVPACIRVDYCANVTCLNGGTCLELLQEAECVCAPGYAGAICDTDVDDCATVPCLHGGTCIDDVSGFRCRCDVEHFVGRTCHEEKVLNPVVRSLTPEFGPAAGGTVITLEGKDFIYPVESVFIGNDSNPCDVTYSDRHKIILLTRPSDTAEIGVHFLVRVMYAGGLLVQTELLYQYRANPQIQRIYPLATVHEGGTTMTVQGTHLDAVSSPWLQVTMIYTRRMKMNGEIQEDITKRVFTSLCAVVNDTEITCQTPALSIPPEFKALLMSAERQPANDQYGPNRARRQAPDSLINFSTGEADLEFFIGFMFDGYHDYTMLAGHDTLGQFGRLSVHRTPRIRLYDPKHLMYFEKHKAISIVGEDMNAALFMSDYAVQVGMSTCDDLTMDGSMLSCMPPQSKPQLRTDNSSPNPVILVKFGSNMQFEYAQMKYGSSNTLWIGLGCAAALLVTAIVVFGILIARHRGKRMAKHRGVQNRQLPSPKQPHVFIKDSVQPVYTNPRTGRSTPDESYEKPVTQNNRERNGNNNPGVYRGYYEDQRIQLPFGNASHISGRQSPTSYDRSGQDDKPGRYRKNKNQNPKTHIRKTKQRLDSGKIGPECPVEGFPRYHDPDEASYLSLDGDSGSENYVKLADLLEDENFYVDIEEALRQASSSANPRREFQSYMIRMVSRMSRKVPRGHRRPTMYPAGYSGLKSGSNQPEQADAPPRTGAPTTSKTEDIIDPIFNEPIYNTSNKQVLNIQVGSSSLEQDPMSLDGDPVYISSQQRHSEAEGGRLWRSRHQKNASAQPGSSRNTGYDGRTNVHSGSLDVQDTEDSDGEFIDNPDYVDQWQSKVGYATGSKLDQLGYSRGSQPGRLGGSEEQTMPKLDDPDDWPVYHGSN